MATMMDKAKQLVGHMLRNVHSSQDKMASAQATGHDEIQLSSDSFAPGMPIPVKYTQDGESISPALEWAGVPEHTASLVLICEDPDTPTPQPIVHWIAYNLPSHLCELPEGMPARLIPMGGRQGKNSMGKEQYVGPKPPLGHGVHHYHFELFALDRDLDFDQTPNKAEVVERMRGHVLAQGDLVGTYERNAA